jgi:crossover junction endodeoxyribonuclease RusA
MHDGEPCPYLVAACHIQGLPDPRELVSEWRINLPYEKPPMTLNNMPSNPFAKASKVKEIKARVRNAVRDAGVPHLDRVHVELHYRGKTNALKDADNLIATLKPAIDALHHADDLESKNLDVERRWVPIVDDDDGRYVTWRRPVLHRAEKGKPGAVWLILRSYAPSTEGNPE